MIGDKFISSMDIGTSYIVAAAAKIDRRGRILSLDVVESKTKGIEKGIITDVGKLADSLKVALRSLSAKIKSKTKAVVLTINRHHVTARHSHSAIPLAERTHRAVSPVDVIRLNKQARLLGVRLDEEFLHEFPQGYTVDDGAPLQNPIGLFAKKVEVDSYLIIAKAVQVDNLVHAARQAGLDALDVQLSSVAASFAVLDEAAKQDGCVLIDIGTDSSEVLVFKGGLVRQLAVIPFGGTTISEAIAGRFKLSFDLAEELKKSYGIACSSDISDARQVLIKHNADYQPIQQKVICEAIEQQVDIFIGLVKAKIGTVLSKEQFPGGVSVIGATALLPGLLERIEAGLTLPVRALRIKHVNLPSAKVPLYATAIGLLSCAIETSVRKSMYVSQQHNVVMRFIGRINEIYQEYF